VFENPYEDDMKAVLRVPEEQRIICTVAVGYPIEHPTKDRRPLEELVSYETYNG
jgi:nitroreductase